MLCFSICVKTARYVKTMLRDVFTGGYSWGHYENERNIYELTHIKFFFLLPHNIAFYII